MNHNHHPQPRVSKSHVSGICAYNGDLCRIPQGPVAYKAGIDAGIVCLARKISKAVVYRSIPVILIDLFCWQGKGVLSWVGECECVVEIWWKKPK